MAVLIFSKVKGQTEEGYNGVLMAVRDSIRKAPGFICHFAHPAEGEWHIYEVWTSKAEADAWFGKNVIPHLPKGVHPKRSYQELFSVVDPEQL